MEYIDGEDLASLLRRIGRLPGDKAIEIARQLCAGLAAAHEQGVLHRDLKPANIMIDGRGRVRITDFGLAALAAELEHGASPAGTPAYMAPEQFAGGQLSERADLYALGLILYEIYTGKPAFRGSSLAEIRHLHEETTPSRPSTLIADLDPSRRARHPPLPREGPTGPSRLSDGGLGRAPRRRRARRCAGRRGDAVPRARGRLGGSGCDAASLGMGLPHRDRHFLRGNRTRQRRILARRASTAPEVAAGARGSRPRNPAGPRPRRPAGRRGAGPHGGSRPPRIHRTDEPIAGSVARSAKESCRQSASGIGRVQRNSFRRAPTGSCARMIRRSPCRGWRSPSSTHKVACSSTAPFPATRPRAARQPLSIGRLSSSPPGSIRRRSLPRLRAGRRPSSATRARLGPWTIGPFPERRSRSRPLRSPAALYTSSSPAPGASTPTTTRLVPPNFPTTLPA